MARTNAALMVQGMGMGMQVLNLLITKVKDRGVSEELFQFMTRSAFEHNVDIIADAIVGCDWKIPASKVRQLARDIYGYRFKERQEILNGEVQNLWWKMPLENLGIPIEETYSDLAPYKHQPVPNWIRNQLYLQPMSYPLILQNVNKVVVDIELVSCERLPKEGEAIDSEKIRRISITDARYFDFNK